MRWRKHALPFDRLLMFDSEAEKIARWALEWPRMETGGDLYGYYTIERRPIVLVATGPGPRAQHTEMNFVQDLDYLQETFRALASRYRLFYLGDWHSHHVMDLDEPSGPDNAKIADLARKNDWSELSSIVIQTSPNRSLGKRSHGVLWNTFAHSVKRHGHESGRIELDFILHPSPMFERGSTSRAPVDRQFARAPLPETRRRDEKQPTTFHAPEVVTSISRRISGRLVSAEIEIAEITTNDATLLIDDGLLHVWARLPLHDGLPAAIGIRDPVSGGSVQLATLINDSDDEQYEHQVVDLVATALDFMAAVEPGRCTSGGFNAFRESRRAV